MSATKPHPSLQLSGGGLDSFLPAFTTLNQPYRAYPIVGSNTHVETIFAYFFRSTPDVSLRRECLRTKDNGAVSLDWVVGDDYSLPPSSPTLILLPGLTGGSGDSYIRHMLMSARKKGWRVVVFNSRGCGHGPVTTPKFYSASFMGDISEVVDHVSSRYPDANLYAAGWSLGGNLIVRYLAQESAGCRLSGAVSLCNPFDLVAADEDLRKGFSIVYDKIIASTLRGIFKKHALLFEEMSDEYNIPAAANCRSIREFDEALTSVSFGFKSVDDYYLKSSSSDSIQHVRTPLLCIQAENDPIAPARGIPREAINANSNCMLIVTPEGGHLGWVAGDDAPFGCPWTDPVVMDFLEYLEKIKSNYVLKPEEKTHTLQANVN
ncbi:putative alcohol O-acetyltransferase [Helianthus annuus]|uniref:Alcohol O-acetyltransferase n=1 Tax=Helianthus annuus TaxID=4232 RepID=A0A9K3GSR5_HELAN|nr:embryogenesis-associated protein EMB8 [Helianthus annuus]KAF5753418.1 putative alcohol O-acetyltransferase [Helianthus annuus]KAJ0427508.1 putative alcohol O-acetyltransferase [Helianthus annuus]KAJ0445789.1 putative alcohol O-acetyltransferase [Helianthus annuus]KAJ0630756.1 putative alcohol O-acetyltransferase [Helianthus annuus]KAJ0824257.1 putative alcohol O-acetyltransferase [Helianthus annuus]